ncbi:MAG: alginate lyase family protein [Pirellulales bacterium]|nr:alginate lyase family protein [Pirellulales bacterium]
MKLATTPITLLAALCLGGEAPAAANSPISPMAVGDEKAFFSLLDMDRPELSGVKQAAAAGDWPAAKRAWARHLETRAQPRWLWSRRDRAELIRIHREKFGGFARYTNAADRVLARDFEFLGVRKQLEHRVEWLHGPIEWTHVLSRFGYWRDLGYAYWATGKSAYAEDFAFLLKSWIAENPVPSEPSSNRGTRGSVWRTLEAGIRGDVWFDAMELFMDAPEFDAEAKFLMTRSLVEHARYLLARSTAYRAGNWQVCETSGLATIGIMLPEFKESSAWRERGFHYLVEHMRRDVEPDGAHRELTPGYHSWVMMEFLKVNLLSRANGYEVHGLVERLEKMFEFLMHLRQPDGTYALVGDAGYARERNRVDESLGLGALVFQRSDLRYLGADQCSESWLWLFGPAVCDRYARLEKRPPTFTSALLPHAKYAVMRTGWEPDARFLLFDCAAWGSGHSHQDRLQVIVCAGRELLVDPGMYSYDQPLSGEYLRKSEAHNVLMIDGAEQPASNPELLAWQSGSEADFASGRIQGKGLRHERSVLFVKPHYWVVVDHVFGGGEHELTRLFHFPLDSAVRAAGNAAQTGFETGANIRIQPTDDARLELRQGWIPTTDAAAERAPVAALLARRALPTALCTVLIPFDAEAALPKIEPIASTDPLVARLRVTFSNGQQDEIAIAPESTALKLGSEEAKARALCVRRGPMSNNVIIVEGQSPK